MAIEIQLFDVFEQTLVEFNPDSRRILQMDPGLVPQCLDFSAPTIREVFFVVYLIWNLQSYFVK